MPRGLPVLEPMSLLEIVCIFFPVLSMVFFAFFFFFFFFEDFGLDCLAINVG
jgi:hypothetical protein